MQARKTNNHTESSNQTMPPHNSPPTGPVHDTRTHRVWRPVQVGRQGDIGTAVQPRRLPLLGDKRHKLRRVDRSLALVAKVLIGEEHGLDLLVIAPTSQVPVSQCPTTHT